MRDPEVRSYVPISVVIPTYNRASLLVRAVVSAIAALRLDDEIIVVDDGSTDNTIDVLRPYLTRIRLVQAKHSGAGAARNKGIELAKNRWVAFLDSDDEWDADKIELQRPLLEYYKDVAYVFTDFRVRLANGKVHPRYLRHWSRDPRPWEKILGAPRAYSEIAPLPNGRADFRIYQGNLYRELMFRPYLAAFTYLFRKDCGETLPMFAVDLPTLEDWQFFAQVAKQGTGLYMDCETATQHGHTGPRLSSVPEVDSINSRLEILQRVWGSDDGFLQREAGSYSVVRQALEQRRAFLLGRRLALDGRLGEARATLVRAGKVPWKYRILFKLPDPVVRGVMLILSILGSG